MIKKEKSPVPALEHGLDIVEYILSVGQPVGFNEILSSLNVSRASAARIIKVLKQRDYIRSDPSSGKYCPGRNLAGFSANFQHADTLRLLSTPLMTEFSHEIGDKTVILFLRTGMGMLVVNKVQPENAESMIDVGKTNSDFGNNPWGWLFYHDMSERDRERAEQKMSRIELFRKRSRARNAFFEKHGCFFDDCEIREYRRRLAAPVVHQGTLIAAQGIGASILDLPDQAVAETARILIDYAQKISELL